MGNSFNILDYPGKEINKEKTICLLSSSIIIDGVIYDGKIINSDKFLGWVSPVKILNDTNTDFNKNDWIVSSELNVYVSVNGNSDNDGLSPENPKGIIGDGLDVIANSGVSNATLYVESGRYYRLKNGKGKSPDANINIICNDGLAEITTQFEPENLNWDTIGLSNNTYHVNRSAVSWIYDYSIKNSDNIEQKLELVNSIQECENMVGSFFISLSDIYVHLSDNRAPDNNTILMGDLANLKMQSNSIWYLENIIIEGGKTSDNAAFPAIETYNINSRLVCVNCKTKNNIGNGWRIRGLPLTIFKNCGAYQNSLDGFNYHEINGIEPHALEIDCVGIYNGLDTNDNGSSVHDNGRIIRIGGVYHHNKGPQIIEVQTARSFNISCAANDSKSTSQNLTNTGFYAANNALMYIKKGLSLNNVYSLYNSGDGEIYVYLGVYENLKNGNITEICNLI